MRSTSYLALLVGLLALASPARAAQCPTTVVYESTGIGSVDAGWTGQHHDLPLRGPTMSFTVACGPTSPPCGTCTITGVAPLPPAAPLRCEDDTSRSCSVATEVADCGTPGSCRTQLGPPQSTPDSAFLPPLCITTAVGGPVSGTVGIESGVLAPTIAVHANVFLGMGTNQGCPRCVDDALANDGLRAGTCDSGPRATMDCDANATSVFTDFGSTSFDCPPGSALQLMGLTLPALAASTGTLSRTLGPASPRCPFFGGVACFCGQCNNANAEPCFSNADCPPSGGNPGICGGNQCVGGSNSGVPCSAHSECPGGGLCGRPGEPARPDACVDDTATEDCAALPGGEGICVSGPIDQFCNNHPNRRCFDDADCDAVFGACTVSNRPCFPDNGLDGATISASGTATAPVGGIADPVDLAVLGCLPSSGSTTYNNAVGLPGLMRSTYPGRLLIVDPAATPIATPTALPTPIPEACSAGPAACRPPVVAGKSLVQLTDSPSDQKDRLQWKWNRGTASSLADFGNPMASDTYALCLYEATTLRATMQIPPGGTCGTRPCWRASSKGFAYTDNAGTPDGITKLVLRTGLDGRASILAKGLGAQLPMPVVGAFTGTVRVQLRNRTTGLCWDVAFPPPFKKLTGERLNAKD